MSHWADKPCPRCWVSDTGLLLSHALGLQRHKLDMSITSVLGQLMLLCVLYSDDWELSLDSEKRENKSYLESQVNVDTLSIYFLVI